MSIQKKHYYITHSSFKDGNSGHDLDQQYNSTIDLNTNKISKALLEKMRLYISNEIETDYPNMRVKDLRLNSISYLGEMTEEEFNS